MVRDTHRPSLPKAEPVKRAVFSKIMETLEELRAHYMVSKAEYFKAIQEGRENALLQQEWKQRKRRYKEAKRVGGSAASLLRDGISFDAFYLVMAIDEVQVERDVGENGIAHALFQMLDSEALQGDGHVKEDGMLSQHELRSAFSRMHGFDGVSVEDFLYLFKLNPEGQIEEKDQKIEALEAQTQPQLSGASSSAQRAGTPI